MAYTIALIWSLMMWAVIIAVIISTKVKGARGGRSADLGVLVVRLLRADRGRRAGGGRSPDRRVDDRTRRGYVAHWLRARGAVVHRVD